MKKIAVLLLVALLLCTAACSGNTSAPSPTASPASSGGTSDDVQTYTGILEQIKSDSILITPEDDESTVYTFGTEGIAVDAQLGDKVTVTYTGDLDDAESLLEASKVEMVK